MKEELHVYFSKVRGTGVLSTVDSAGRVNSAIFSRPHILGLDRLAFIMRARLTHANLQSNPHAAYLFREEGEGYHGVRLHLTRIEESEDTALIDSLRRVRYTDDHLVRRILATFRVDRQMPLIGAGEASGREAPGTEGEESTRKALGTESPAPE